MTVLTRVSGARSRRARTRLPVCVCYLALFIIGERLSIAQESDNVEFETIASLMMLDGGATVADIGAGNGFWTVKLACRVGRQGLVYATEVKPELAREIQLAASREHLRQIRVIVAQHLDPRLPNACCDAVLMRFVYHSLRDRTLTLKGLRGALKPGGRLLVVDYRPGLPELTQQMREFGFEVVKLMDPWLGRKETYGALFVRIAGL
jgi:ubiquinone/menaquinone biosynthesis C-methylase UbiE